MRKFNNWLAIKITNLVSTMWCAYLLTALAVYGFPYGSGRPGDYVEWFSVEFFQLVMLSIIMVQQKVMTDHHEAHSKKLDVLIRHGISSGKAVDNTVDNGARNVDISPPG